MPHAPDVPWTALLPGAVVFGVGLEVLHLVTVYWIADQMEHKTDTYGAIGFALALLLWAYLLGRLITSAAVINETLWTRYRTTQRRVAARAARRPVGDAQPASRHQAPGHAAGDPGRLGREDRRGEGEHEHVAGDERHDARVEAGLGAQRRDDQGELAPGRGSWWRGWWRVPARALSGAPRRSRRRSSRPPSSRPRSAIGPGDRRHVAGIDGQPEGEEEQRGERVAQRAARACARGVRPWSPPARVRP